MKLKKSFKKTSFAIGARVENNKWQLTEDSSKKTTYKDFYFFRTKKNGFIWGIGCKVHITVYWFAFDCADVARKFEK